MQNRPKDENKIENLNDVKVEVVTDDLSLLGVPGVMVEVDPETAESLGASYTPDDELEIMFKEGD
ncbi:hypothetical protein HGD77_16620 (plasmid) [Acinetobacter sp. NEB149]|jgi:hypothetical protein|uniref:hypothetical protein n=1 Tax=Acinetobacter sp. NEB149 TaxID=2725684 RepID=UPI001448E9C3|nr:hypothetical protein [Acinetobacter sp. NEB149]QJB50217.1 hypothetical protein HGD77_16620 [Acinetobacter sp. NEB149]